MLPQVQASFRKQLWGRGGRYRVFLCLGWACHPPTPHQAPSNAADPNNGVGEGWQIPAFSPSGPEPWL